MRRNALALGVLLLLAPRVAAAGGCGGAAAIAEMAALSLTFPMGVAVAPDGAIWVASTLADRLVRFDPASGVVSAVKLPLHSHPAGLVVDPEGRVWFAASGKGLVARMTPGALRAAEFAPPSLLDAQRGLPAPWSIALDARHARVWFTLRPDGVVGSVDIGATPTRKGSVVREIVLDRSFTRPEAVAADREGAVWVTELAADRLTRIGPDGLLRRFALPPGSRPRGVAAAPDGSVWVGLFGADRLLRVDPSTFAVRSWPMPSAPRSSPYAVTVDGGGRVWVSEFTANTVTCFDPATQRFAVWQVPTPGAGVRALAADREGRIWFVGSYSGRLGVVASPPLHRDRIGP